MNAPTLSRRGFVRASLGALVAPGVAGACLSEPPPTAIPVEPRLTARPDEPTLSPTPGVVTDLGLGGSRDGYLYVPGSYTPETPMPLFVGLHGAGGEGRNWTSYPERAEALGMIVLAPDSRGRTWDILRGSFGPDVEFLDSALRHTFQRCNVDPGRIALGGFSDGASYALSLGVANGDLFTHLVAYSPGFWVAGHPITGSPRVFASHGRSDGILPYANTADTLVPWLRDEGYEVTFHSFEGGHEVPAEVSDTALAWFLEG